MQLQAQDMAHYKRIVKALSSAKYQGRGYAKNGANKAGKYLQKEYRKAGADRMYADLQKPEYANALVCCDFWFSYNHRKDFARLQKKGECTNAGLLQTWTSPIKFYKAYGEKVRDVPIVWTCISCPSLVRMPILEGLSSLRTIPSYLWSKSNTSLIST